MLSNLKQNIREQNIASTWWKGSNNLKVADDPTHGNIIFHREGNDLMRIEELKKNLS